MKKHAVISIIFFSVVGLFPLAILGAPSPKESAELTGLLSKLQTYQASFEQSQFNDKGQPIQKKGYGRLWIKRPGKLRWEVKTPTQQTTIINGKIIWLYDVDLAQATKEVLTQTSNNPASLLSNAPAEVAKQFRVQEQQSQGLQIFTLYPQSKKEMGVEWIALKFSEKQLIGMTFRDSLGQKNIFNFTQVRSNTPLDDRLFQFEPPKGVDVIDHS